RLNKKKKKLILKTQNQTEARGRRRAKGRGEKKPSSQPPSGRAAGAWWPARQGRPPATTVAPVRQPGAGRWGRNRGEREERRGERKRGKICDSGQTSHPIDAMLVPLES